MAIIVAVDSQGGFGKDGQIPWDCPEDFSHFMKLSKEYGVCVMGRRTYEDLVNIRRSKGVTLEEIDTNGILPDRVTMVVSTSDGEFCGAVKVSDLREARREAHEAGFNTIAVLGGERLYTQAIASAKTVHLTVMNGNYGCDVFFPVKELERYTLIRTERLGGSLSPLALTYQQ